MPFLDTLGRIWLGALFLDPSLYCCVHRGAWFFIPTSNSGALAMPLSLVQSWNVSQTRFDLRNTALLIVTRSKSNRNGLCWLVTDT